MKKAPIFLVAVLLCLFCFSLVVAHAPLNTKDNESVDSATVIPDPTKSWVLYSVLNSDGDPQYYTFNISAGQKIPVTLIKSMQANESSFLPMFAILGSDLPNQGILPDKVTVPLGDNWQVVNSGSPTPTYEPFSPSSFYTLSNQVFNAPSTGQYYIVVYENASTPTGGHYSLAIGDRETYTLDEWVLLPISLLNIYIWEGQVFFAIIAPLIATVVVGLILVAWFLRRQGRLGNVFAWMGAFTGLILVGSGLDTLLQLFVANYGTFGGLEMLITLVFTVFPIVLGALALRFSLMPSGRVGVRHRIYFVVIGVTALFLLAGIFIGPIAAIVTSVMPTNLRQKQK